MGKYQDHSDEKLLQTLETHRLNGDLTIGHAIAAEERGPAFRALLDEQPELRDAMRAMTPRTHRSIAPGREIGNAVAALGRIAPGFNLADASPSLRMAAGFNLAEQAQAIYSSPAIRPPKIDLGGVVDEEAVAAMADTMAKDRQAKLETAEASARTVELLEAAAEVARERHDQLVVSSEQMRREIQRGRRPRWEEVAGLWAAVIAALTGVVAVVVALL